MEQIPILYHRQPQDRSLRRLLSAFEQKISGTAEQTLLYLLSLSAKPISVEQMEQIFRRTFIARLFVRNSEYQKFLTPLSKLNRDGWHKTVERLHALHLLNYTESPQGLLLRLDSRIGDYFRQKLEIQKYRILQHAYKDMMIVNNKVTSYGMPATFSNTLLTQSHHQQKEHHHNASAITTENTQKQLHALRQSLKMLAEQSQKLSMLRQASDTSQQNYPILAQRNSHAA